MRINRYGWLVLCLLAVAFVTTARADDDIGGRRRIFGGVPTTIDKHPWQVAIFIDSPDNRRKFLCGGSLIYQRWILTAAHCLADTTPAGIIHVKAGVTDYNASGGWLDAKQIVKNPSYNSITHENDIALIELKTPPSDSISQVIPLAGSATALGGKELEVTGWGKMETGTQPNKLMVAYVPYVDNAECNKPESYDGRIKPTMMCAGKKGIDSCQGDSGGPLVLGKNRDEAILVGVVSFGEGCGEPNKFGVYTRVSAFRDWIHRTVNAR